MPSRRICVLLACFSTLLLAAVGVQGAQFLPPTLTKTFFPSAVPVNGTTTLTFVLSNPNPAATLSGVYFSDHLPEGITSPNVPPSSLCGGQFSIVSNIVEWDGVSLDGGQSCSATISIVTTSITPFDIVNTTSSVGSTNGGIGQPATATLSIVAGIAPPAISALVFENTIPVNGSTLIEFNIANPNQGSPSLTGIGFSAVLPAGLTASMATNNCGGTVQVVANTISLTNGSTNTLCSVVVPVTGTTPGKKTVTTSNVSSSNGGTGNATSVSLYVLSPPVLSKSYFPAVIPLNGTSTLTFTLSNPNPFGTLTGIAYTDTFPAGAPANGNNFSVACEVAGSLTLTEYSASNGTLAGGQSCTDSMTVTGTMTGDWLDTTSAVTSTNGGTGNAATATLSVVSGIAPPAIRVTLPDTFPAHGDSDFLHVQIVNPNPQTTLSGINFSITLPPGLTIPDHTVVGVCGGTLQFLSNVISLSGGSIPGGETCDLSLSISGVTPGVKTVMTSAVTSTNGGTGNIGSATTLVLTPPVITKSFDPPVTRAFIPSKLIVTISNPNPTTALVGINFTDTLPAGLLLSNFSPPSCGATSYTSDLTSFSGLNWSLPPGAQCSMEEEVTAGAAGVYTNTTGIVSSTNGGLGNTATATLTIPVPPTISKAFGATTIGLNGTTTLTFTISNPNAGADGTLTGINFTDLLVPGLTSPNGTSPHCGGTLTVTGNNSIQLLGASLAPGASCTIVVSVTGTTAGTFNNVTNTVISAETGEGNSAMATLVVLAPPTIGKAFGAPSVPLGGTTTLSLTLANPNANQALTGVAVTDTLPAGLVIATPANVVGNCNGGTVQVAGGNAGISLTGGSLTAGGQCTIVVNVTGVAAGHAVNTTGAVSAGIGGTGNVATADIDVVAPPVIAKSFAPNLVFIGEPTVLTFTITNPAANTVALTGVGFTDVLPGMSVSNAGVSGSCGGGTITAVVGSGSIALANATLPVGGSCTFSVGIVPVAIGQLQNTTNPVTSANGGAGNSATAVLESKQRVIPTLSPAGLGLLAVLLLVIGGFVRRGRRTWRSDQRA